MLIGEGGLRYATGGENLQVVRIILTFPAAALFLSARIRRKQMTNGFNFEMATVNFGGKVSQRPGSPQSFKLKSMHHCTQVKVSWDRRCS